MVIDTSAILAILLDEPEEPIFIRAIAAAPRCLLSAATRLEAEIVTWGHKRDAGLVELRLFLKRTAIEIVPVTASQAEIACEAFHRFGKGRHAAGLNFGDCFAYALARDTGEPLLFKGQDFARTDITSAVPTGAGP